MMELLSESSCNLGLKLLKDIVSDGQTVVMSPLSITLSLGSLYVGAAGETKRVLRNAVFPMNVEEEDILENLKKIECLVGRPNDNHALTMANRLYYSRDLQIRTEYTQILNKYFKCDAVDSNFAQKNLEESRQEINAWMTGVSKNKIRDILSVGFLKADSTGAVLIDGVYCENVWDNCAVKHKQKFKPNQTTEILVDMMTTFGNRMKYTTTDTCEVLGVPFSCGENESEAAENSNSVMAFFVLPNEGIDLNRFENDLTGHGLNKLLNSVYSSAVHAEIPLIHVQQRFDLTEPLKHIGLNVLSDQGGADFSGMFNTENKSGHLSGIMHTAYIENKFTSKNLMKRSQLRKEPHYFVADRPFIFAVVEQRSMSFLLLGHYFG